MWTLEKCKSLIMTEVIEVVKNLTCSGCQGNSRIMTRFTKRLNALDMVTLSWWHKN